MIVKTLHVQWFRSIVDEKIECSQLTALLGPNGCGKSSFLRALDLFYAPVPRLSEDDFYAGDTSCEIQIEVTFTELTLEEKEHFYAYLWQEDLSILRMFSFQNGKVSDKCYGYQCQNADFLPVRAAPRATEQRPLYEELRRQEKYSTLLQWTRKEAALAYLEQWEQANPDTCTRQRDNGDFFCLKKGEPGDLTQYTRFLFIPAVRDAGTDAADGKGSVIAELLNLAVRNSFMGRPEFKQFEVEFQSRYEELFQPEKMFEMKNLETKLTETLEDYVPGALVNLTWSMNSQINIPLPKADVKVMEDGYPSDITRKGHGLQRVFIVTILQHLSAAQLSPAVSQNEANEEEVSSSATQQLPTLILVIEEPELYQHPSRQRHFANVLFKLAGGIIGGVAQRTQVLYCTHSPLFVGVDRFDQIRLLRKVSSQVNKPKFTKVTSTTLDDVAQRMWLASGSSSIPFTGETIRSRLHSLMTPWINEGFFADVVVLVEGEDDRVAIQAVAMLLDHDLESMGISVIPCGGKSNLDRAAAIFLNLAIPTYVVWDGDRQLTSRTDQDRAIQENRRLMMLMGRPAEDWPEAVTAHFACFATTMDKTLKQEIGEAEYTRLFQECVDEFGYSRVEYAKKNPIVIATCLQRAKEAGRKSVTLEKIIMKILELHRSSQIEDERHMPILSDVVEMENDDALVMPREPVTVQADVL